MAEALAYLALRSPNMPMIGNGEGCAFWSLWYVNTYGMEWLPMPSWSALHDATERAGWTCE